MSVGKRRTTSWTLFSIQMTRRRQLPRHDSGWCFRKCHDPERLADSVPQRTQHLLLASLVTSALFHQDYLNSLSITKTGKKKNFGHKPVKYFSWWIEGNKTEAAQTVLCCKSQQRSRLHQPKGIDHNAERFITAIDLACDPGAEIQENWKGIPMVMKSPSLTGLTVLSSS